ncbi:hypothetical protein L2E82_08290 [Cichorium intybus]|uniref:Uncharacterized protein n=1 Tax=Cichorium intybus TaxID=13427 RepID=A0ACB9G792_CICIN|nr:hypothetical protein L2E82_08290 [Cichorium intybus]
MAVSGCVWCIARPSSSFTNRKLIIHLNSCEAEVTGGQVGAFPGRCPVILPVLQRKEIEAWLEGAVVCAYKLWQYMAGSKSWVEFLTMLQAIFGCHLSDV